MINMTRRRRRQSSGTHSNIGKKQRRLDYYYYTKMASNIQRDIDMDFNESEEIVDGQNDQDNNETKAAVDGATGGSKDPDPDEYDDSNIKDMFKQILNEIKSVKTDMVGIKNDLKTCRNEVSELKSSNDFLSDTLKDVQSKQREHEHKIKKIDEQDEKIKVLERANKHLKSEIQRLELYSRRENLRFDGIKESDQENCSQIILNICKDKLGIVDATSRILISRCHRIGKKENKTSRPRSILIRFQFSSHRDEVWNQRKKLKGTHVFINEDLPKELETQKRSLLPLAKAARDMGQKATVQGTYLIVDGKRYTRETLHQLPQKCSPRCLSEKRSTNYLFFQGEYSPFSNFYRSKFELGGKHYTSVEQYYQLQKAEYAGDQLTLDTMTQTDIPRELKTLGSSMSMDKKKWLFEFARTVMTDALMAKFTQSEYLKQILKATGSIGLVECSKHDDTWAIGLDITDSNRTDVTQWRGKNWLGTCLMDVRDRL